MRRLVFAVFVLAGLCGQAAAQTASDAIQSAQRFREMSIADAGAAGRWVVWTSGTAPDTTVTLSLVGPQKRGVWSQTWPGAYGPGLRLVPEWQHAGAAMLAVTVQFGAAAEEVDLFGLAEGKPVKLASEMASAVGWAIAPDGQLLLVLYNMPAASLMPSCYGWDDTKVKLTPQDCPRG